MIDGEDFVDNVGACLFGIIGGAVAVAGLTALFSLGPLDLGRTVYNNLIGDSQTLKRQLVDYSRNDIRRKNPDYSREDVEKILINELRIYGQDKINPSDVSMSRLWDSSEEHAGSWYQEWVWPSLD